MRNGIAEQNICLFDSVQYDFFLYSIDSYKIRIFSYFKRSRIVLCEDIFPQKLKQSNTKDKLFKARRAINCLKKGTNKSILFSKSNGYNAYENEKP